jgi:hypothetical protein
MGSSLPGVMYRPKKYSDLIPFSVPKKIRVTLCKADTHIAITYAFGDVFLLFMYREGL